MLWGKLCHVTIKNYKNIQNKAFNVRQLLCKFEVQK